MLRYLLTLFALSGVVLGQDLILGTGSPSGAYFPIGTAVAEIVGMVDPSLQIEVAVTAGSVSNLEALRGGDLALALAQSDIVHQAFQGNQVFKGRPIVGLRSLMALHPEPTHLICDREAGVTSFREIAGKWVSIGNPGSGMLQTAQIMLEAFGMSEEDFAPLYLNPGEAMEALQAGELDCALVIVGIGSPAIKELASSGDVVFVELAEPKLDALIQAKPYYSYATLPANTYPGQSEELTLFGVKALLVTSTELAEETAHGIVQAILANLDNLSNAHPALAGLSRENLLKGLGAPLHPGAARAYRE